MSGSEGSFRVKRYDTGVDEILVAKHTGFSKGSLLAMLAGLVDERPR
jgi:hypothetical protein